MMRTRALTACAIVVIATIGLAQAQTLVPPPAAPVVPAAPPLPDPEGAKAAHDAGVAKLRAGAAGEAAALLQAARAKNPTSAAIAHDLGTALVALGARREAEAQFKAALALEPRRTASYTSLAELFTQSPDRWQRIDEVRAIFDKGLAFVRDDARARALVALALAGFEQSVGRLAEAKSRIEAVLRDANAAPVRSRALDLLGAIEADERALGLADWNEPALPPAAETEAHAIEALLEAGRNDDALPRAAAFARAQPRSSIARFLHARALAALARPDQAIDQLGLVVQLRPSHAEAWRLLGLLLAQHGGGREVERADEALRRALALEPSWSDLRDLRRQLARRRGEGRGVPPPSPKGPTPHAQQLYQEAQRWMGIDTPELAKVALEEALSESPGFVDAAASFFAISNEVPAETVTALWNDGDALTRLATAVLRIRRDPETADRARPWLDRAVALESAEARFARALFRAEAGDAEGALADLAHYAASGVNPPHLAEAQALRRSLERVPAGTAAATTLGRQLLLADRPRDAARVLGGTCRAGLAPDALIELGRIAEYENRLSDALGCHRLALSAARGARPGGGNDAAGLAPAAVTALDRIARIALAVPAGDARGMVRELEQAERAGLPVASWAFARLAHEDGELAEALERGRTFLGKARPSDPLREQAARTMQAWRTEADERRRTETERLTYIIVALGAFALVALGLAIARRLGSRTVAAALGRAPDLFPDVAAAVAEVRHDVLKHRASALGMLASAPREEITRALREPIPTSVVVANIYDRLRRAAAGVGLNLRPLDREPLFGPLVRRLLRAERLVDRPDAEAELAEIDERLREEDGPALGTLLAICPRTRLDPGEVATWLRAIAGPGTTAGNGHGANGAVVPGLHLPALDLEVPLPREAFHTILANLVRNAVGALADAPDPHLLVRVEQERDATGRRLVTCLIADSAERLVSLDEIERRDGQRGLGIVRDLVRRWGGHLIVRPEARPYVKSIGAAFPANTGGASAP